MTATKKDIIREVAQKTGIDIVDVKDMVQVMFDAMCEGLAQDQNIEIRNFGIFRVKYTPERKARNPKTSEIITVAPKRHISFKPGQQLRTRINQDPEPEEETINDGQGDETATSSPETAPPTPTFGGFPPSGGDSHPGQP